MLAAVSSLHSSQQPGVGLFFHESAGKIKVKTIVSGGSAERDGRIQVGDTLIAIDGVDVRGQSQAAPFFKNLITGPEGSTVRLKMLRGEASSAFGYELELFRGTPEYFAGLEQERRNEEELSELKLQLKQALAEEQQVAEEVDRIKRLLLAERQERERREKDQEVLHIGTHPHHTPHTYTHTVIHCKATCCCWRRHLRKTGTCKRGKNCVHRIYPHAGAGGHV